jgi:hypothetical protein
VVNLDKTIDYRTMAEKAKEIQSSWKPENGDWFLCVQPYADNEISCCGDVQVPYDNEIWEYDYYEGGDKISQDWCIWLPRQDQLQDMIGGFGKQLRHFLTIIQRGYNPPDCETWDIMVGIDNKYCKSMEQLWLCFVMKEKHNKKWNGKDWAILED